MSHLPFLCSNTAVSHPGIARFPSLILTLIVHSVAIHATLSNAEMEYHASAKDAVSD